MLRFRKRNPQKMLGFLLILLALLSYLSIDVYNKELARIKAKNKSSVNVVPNASPAKPQAKEINTIPVKEVEGSRPESSVITPGAKIILETHFLKCGHVTKVETNVSDNMVNLTEAQLMLVYKGWEIQKFSSQEIILVKNINSKCPSHYILKDKDGYVAVFYQTSINGISLKEVTPILLQNLRIEDQEKLKAGIPIDSQQELAQTLEDLGS